MTNRSSVSFRVALGVLAAYMLLGLGLNLLVPLSSVDQWLRIFLWGTPLRAGVFFLLLWADRRFGGRTPLGFAGMRAPRVLLYGALMLALWSVFLTQARGEPWSWGARALGIPACLFVGLLEEYLFRGVLLDGFLDRYGSQRAALASSILFMIFHTRPQALAAWPHIFLTGAVFANLRLRGMSLGHLALVHAAVDSLFFLHGREGVTRFGPAYWVFLAGLFLYAALTAPLSKIKGPRRGVFSPGLSR
ncbi:MAG: CPBP family intramembrane metalloprotease [Elusimicrobia bacterium]|nr:CPBP family intramembrane metalloprotease [Elusimicrobiota bacterium]